MRQRMAAEIGLTPEEVGGLQPLEFYHDDGSAKETERRQLASKPAAGVLWKD